MGPRLLVLGANHRTAGLSLRDQLFVDDGAQADFLARLDLPEALAISTCDRVEVWAFHPEPEQAKARILAALADHSAQPIEALQDQLYCLTDLAAVRHVFTVTAALDSLVIGEPHILGQVKACHRLAREQGVIGPGLDQLLAASYHVAKRVRSETSLGERPVSLAAVAVQLAQDLHGALPGATALLIGAGEMGELVAEHLQAAKIGSLTVMASRPRRADALARSLECHSAPWESLQDQLARADILVSAVGARSVTLTPDSIGAALKKRRKKPIFLIDTAVPGDIDPAVNRVEGAFLYDLADLERLALKGLADRESAASQAFAIIEAEIEGYFRHRTERQAVPAILLLRQHFEKLRQQSLIDAENDAEKATRLLVNRLLHDPSEMMKLMATHSADWDRVEVMIKRLFRLEG